MVRYNKRLDEELQIRQRQEKVRLPKVQRSEGKTRMMMFKKSLRLSAQAVENEKERIRNVSSDDVIPNLNFLYILAFIDYFMLTTNNIYFLKRCWI